MFFLKFVISIFLQFLKLAKLIEFTLKKTCIQYFWKHLSKKWQSVSNKVTGFDIGIKFQRIVHCIESKEANLPMCKWNFFRLLISLSFSTITWIYGLEVWTILFLNRAWFEITCCVEYPSNCVTKNLHASKGGAIVLVHF